MGQTKLLFFDVDGTLTDGKVYIGSNGEVFKAFCIKDGYGIKNILPSYKITPCIITGRESEIVKRRATELGITEVYQNKQEKLSVLLEVQKKYNCVKEEMAYFGDDILDIPSMLSCNYRGCPADAVDEVKAICSYVCKASAGNGAAREFIEWLVKNEPNNDTR